MYRRSYRGDLLCEGDRLMHMRMRTMQFFQFVGERLLRWWAHLRRRENSTFLLSSRVPSCPSTEDSAESSAFASKQSRHANTCSCPETSHQLDSGENLSDTLTLLPLLLTPAETPDWYEWNINKRKLGILLKTPPSLFTHYRMCREMHSWAVAGCADFLTSENLTPSCSCSLCLSGRDLF